MACSRSMAMLALLTLGAAGCGGGTTKAYWRGWGPVSGLGGSDPGGWRRGPRAEEPGQDGDCARGPGAAGKRADRERSTHPLLEGRRPDRDLRQGAHLRLAQPPDRRTMMLVESDQAVHGGGESCGAHGGRHLSRPRRNARASYCLRPG